MLCHTFLPASSSDPAAVIRDRQQIVEMLRALANSLEAGDAHVSEGSSVSTNPTQVGTKVSVNLFIKP